jgi:hypothetical protein
LRPLCEGWFGGSYVEEGVGQPDGVPYVRIFAPQDFSPFLEKNYPKEVPLRMIRLLPHTKTKKRQFCSFSLFCLHKTIFFIPKVIAAT